MLIEPPVLFFMARRRMTPDAIAVGAIVVLPASKMRALLDVENDTGMEPDVG
jgi:hypothetical protein